ncbi:MAG: 30S ribosomal protein S9 [Dehalococcoidia bacterium]|jgi:small subunit ribosomal protein S9|nr:30S ribosomal protein S9 [Dehalococcoidia bacterium]
MTEQHYYYGTGKRKTAVAQVRLYPGRGEFSINDKSLEDAFPWPAWQSIIQEPMKVTDNQGKFSVFAKLHGGGVTSQAGALRHGIARALLLADADLRPVLKKNGLLTRDSRIKESKKYGLKRARRAPQYTKR